MKTPALDVLQARKTASLQSVEDRRIPNKYKQASPIPLALAGGLAGAGLGYLAGDGEHPLRDTATGAMLGTGAAALAANMSSRMLPGTKIPPEPVPPQYLAYKAAEAPMAPRAPSEMVDMDSFGGALADYMTPQSFGSRRAGRAVTLARAAGVDPAFSVRQPSVSRVLGVLSGIAAGAGLGGLHSRNGLLYGALGGAALGALRDAYRHRTNMGKIVSAADAAHANKSLKPVAPDLGFFTPSPHDAGQVAAYRELIGRGSSDPSMMENLSDAAKTFGGSYASLGSDAYNGMDSRLELKRLQDPNPS